MRLRVLGIQDVAEGHLCCGCGVCAYLSPGSITMVDDLEQGRRPVVRSEGGDEQSLRQAMDACPGIGLKHSFDESDPRFIKALVSGWGPVLEVWEGHATDPEIRFAGSSGGAASALGLFGIERAGMHGVLHIAARSDVPYLNETVLSTGREQILARTGSRYAPASPCDGLGTIEQAPTACVFIGKPCDVAAVANARRVKPELDAKVGFTVAIFCAGAPSTRATLDLAKALGVDDPTQITSVRYRGLGWPGLARITADRGGERVENSTTYKDAWWNYLTRARPWRCHVCPDHTGEFADISVGDPWYKPPADGEPGRSHIIVRTELGRRILREAIAAGYLTASPVDPATFPASQQNLLHVRGATFGRTWVTWVMGAPSPKYVNMHLGRTWLTGLSLKQKVQSVIGTVRRVYRKGLRQRRKVVAFEPVRPAAMDGSKGARV